MDAIQAKFRQVERTLDDLAAAAREAIRSRDVQIIESTERVCPYYSDHLAWGIECAKEWSVRVETARVTVSLAYFEPLQVDEEPMLEVSWRAELFQQYYAATIDIRGEQEWSLPQVQQQGIAWIVMEAIQAGSIHLPKPC